MRGRDWQAAPICSFRSLPRSPKARALDSCCRDKSRRRTGVRSRSRIDRTAEGASQLFDSRLAWRRTEPRNRAVASPLAPCLPSYLSVHKSSANLPSTAHGMLQHVVGAATRYVARRVRASADFPSSARLSSAGAIRDDAKGELMKL